MDHRSKKVIAAVIAAGLLAFAGLSGTVAAHDPGAGFGSGPGFPGASGKPVPSAHVLPSGLKTFTPRTPKPESSVKPLPTRPPLTCAPAPTASATPSSSAEAGVVGSFLDGSRMPGFGPELGLAVFQAESRFYADYAKDFCNIDALRKTLDKLITGRINQFQSLVTRAGKAGLDAPSLAIVDGELNSIVTGLQSLKTTVDAETTLAGLQADFKTFLGDGSVDRTVQSWASLIIGSERLIAAGPGLVTLENKIATEISAAPAGPETTDAQKFLDDMEAKVTAGEALVAPLPAELLAITPAQLADGSANSTLADARVALFSASWDIQMGRWSAARAKWELAEATATPTPTATPTATATPI